MNNENESKKQILKSSAIVGGASLFTIIIGLVKVKVLAELLGPVGIGLMGILTSLMGLGATLFGMGLGTSGVRELAQNSNSKEKLDLVRNALFWANLFLGLTAIFIFFVFKDKLSVWFLDTDEYKSAIAVISIGIFFTLISGSQTALLQGLRQINELAKVRVIGALVATLVGLLTVWIFDESGVPFFIIALPLSTSLVAFYYCQKLPKVSAASFSIKHLGPQWRSMVQVGYAFMLTALMSVGCQFIVRYIINLKLNIESVGYFQAAWQISMTYISFVLGAMAADYYPRLTQIIKNKSESNVLVNEQVEIAIIFAAPILVGMLTFSPFIINILYSAEFNDSTEILRWQVTGDALKIMSWPLGFIILAKGLSKLYFCTELLWNSCYITLVYAGIDFFGVEITGYAFVVSYGIYLIVLYIVSRKINGFSWSNKNFKLMVLLFLYIGLIFTTYYYSFFASLMLGILISIITSIDAIMTMSELGIKNRMLNKFINTCEKYKNRMSL